MDRIPTSSRVFDEIAVGDSASLSCVLPQRDVAPFGRVPEAAISTAKPVSGTVSGVAAEHGGWMTNLITTVLGARLPGPGTLCLEQQTAFLKPVDAGDTITATVTVTGKDVSRHFIFFDTVCTSQKGVQVLAGTATVIAPAERIESKEMQMPDGTLHRNDRFDAIINEARSLPLMPAAIVHPCSPEALLAAVEIREEGLLEPLLVGPEAKIRAAAEKAGVSLEGMRIEPVEHSHAAAARAVELAVTGKVSVIMKGSLHTDELLGAVVASGAGLRTERRISHVYVMDVPAYDKLLVVTDAAINIVPSLEQKRDICQNAIDLLHLIGNPEPRVAVLAAVETVNPKMLATLEAAALTVMAARGQITGARVDGPLAFDNAISPAAAETKGIVSPVAGRADILLVPDLEAGNMLAKQLLYFAGADAAGLVLGARVPIILTSRSDTLKVRIASAALAKLVAMHRRPAPEIVA